MSKTKHRFRMTLAPLLVVAAASAGLALGACQDDVTEPDRESESIDISEEIASACAAYCEKFAECNEETVASECEEKCKGVLYACEQHEEDEALDQVFQCAEEDCFAFPLCTVNAGIQCITGLGL